MSIQLRALSENSGGTCDWGRCNDDAVQERYSEAHGWLPVCQHHTGPKPRTPSPGRGTCRFCNSEYSLTTAGVLRQHDHGFNRCAGSHTPPRPS